MPLLERRRSPFPVKQVTSTTSDLFFEVCGESMALRSRRAEPVDPEWEALMPGLLSDFAKTIVAEKIGNLAVFDGLAISLSSLDVSLAAKLGIVCAKLQRENGRLSSE